VFVKTDHHLSDRQQITLRYSLYDIASDNARTVGGLNDVSRGTRLDNRDQTAALTHIFTPTPHNLFDSRLQYTHSQLGAPGTDIAGPAVNISGVANFGASTTSPIGRDTGMYEWNTTVSMH